MERFTDDQNVKEVANKKILFLLNFENPGNFFLNPQIKKIVLQCIQRENVHN